MSLRVILVAGVGTLVAASAALAGNIAVIGQSGLSNSAYTQQVGRNNKSLTFQDGIVNGATTVQFGRNNAAGVSQSGLVNGAGVYQYGPRPSMP